MTAATTELLRPNDAVMIVFWHVKRPVFHRFIWDGDVADARPSCGAPRYPTSPILRLDHAVEFARPCRRCFR